MMPPVIIGEAKDYHELIVCLRALADRRNASRLMLDAVSGMQEGYCSKLLCIPPIRGLGRVSMGPLLRTLGARLLIVEDPEAIAELEKRLVPRRRRPNSPGN